MEQEYKIVKCETCGHERQGPRIVRLSEQHKREWGKIQKEWNRNMNLGLVPLWLLMILGVFFAVVLSFDGGVLKILLGIALGIALPMGYAYFFIRWRESKLNEEVIKKETEILAQYEVTREEFFEITE